MSDSITKGSWVFYVTTKADKKTPRTVPAKVTAVHPDGSLDLWPSGMGAVTHVEVGKHTQVGRWCGPPPPVRK
jgi:hypothetical protein